MEDPGRHAPSTQQRQTQVVEDRVRASVGRCYDEGICPDGLQLGEVVEDEQGRRFVVYEDVDNIKEGWLKERTVITVFQEEARHLSGQIKEDLIRADEDGWMSQKIFNPEMGRGRIRFEGQNVVSFVAKAKEVADWLLRKKEARLELGPKEYLRTFKPWIPRQELWELRLQEAETNFWIIAPRIQLDAYYYLHGVVSSMFGEVVEMHPPEYGRTRPKLMNVKLDLRPEARFQVDNELIIESPKVERWKVEIVTPYTDWCRKCRWYFHIEENCPRNRHNAERRNERGTRTGGHQERFRQKLRNREQPAGGEVTAVGSRGPRQKGVSGSQDVRRSNGNATQRAQGQELTT
ncbi:hypothetical protein CBR_g522 [Chara braunii]|uniref:Uncharacterized protein n=1 Tax=Chara braunii TaxID=69332 RepID=A0A388KBF0_CHABU|nr:hypothetical protein CBR_g522 [Chara braunii]|eukprot:GBG67385.1 hypothetical protein CBR_g522 [Chara braunii]